MTRKTISDAVTNINAEYIEKAADFHVTKKSKKIRLGKWIAAAACVCLVLVGILQLFTKQPGASPFVLTAYALDNDNSLSSVVMQEGKSVPVNLFETESGLWGFVFSYAADDPEQPTSVSIMNADQQSVETEHIKAISGLEIQQGKNYVFYIPPQDEAAPYSLSLFITDESTNTVGQLDIVIEQSEDGYTARIDKLTTHERKDAP